MIIANDLLLYYFNIFLKFDKYVKKIYIIVLVLQN